MARSGDLQEVVEGILRTNNVELKEFMKEELVKIAGHFHAEGLIERTAVNRMSVTGVGRFRLAAELMDACQPSLMLYPEENFPRFVAVLKKCVTMVKLAEKMEDEFKEASMSWYIFLQLT